jgi:hypothetical protein
LTTNPASSPGRWLESNVAQPNVKLPFEIAILERERDVCERLNIDLETLKTSNVKAMAVFGFSEDWLAEKHKFKVGKLTDDHIALLSRVGSLIFDSVTYNLDEWKPIRGDSRRLMFESFEVGASKATDLQQGCIAFGAPSMMKKSGLAGSYS